MESRIRDVPIDLFAAKGSYLVELWASNLYSRINFVLRNVPFEMQYSQTPYVFTFVQRFIRHIVDNGVHALDLLQKGKYLYRGIDGTFTPPSEYNDHGFLSTSFTESISCGFAQGTPMCGTLQVFLISDMDQSIPFLLINEDVNPIYHEDEVLMLPGKCSLKSSQPEVTLDSRKVQAKYECDWDLVASYLQKPPPKVKKMIGGAPSYDCNNLEGKCIVYYRAVDGHDVEVLSVSKSFDRKQHADVIRYYDRVTNLIPEVRRLRIALSRNKDCSQLHALFSYNVYPALYDGKSQEVNTLHFLIPKMIFNDLFDKKETEARCLCHKAVQGLIRKNITTCT